jgi:hypothetical protein
VSATLLPRQVLLLAGVLGCMAAAVAAGMLVDPLACRLCPADGDLEFGMLEL